MRWQHARTSRLRLGAGLRDLLEHATEGRGRTRNRGRTEGGDPVARQTRGHVANRAAVVQRIHTGHPVHVHVDEPGNDVVAVKRRGGRLERAGADIDDAAALNRQRAW
jgi:hypothetical protein